MFDPGKQTNPEFKRRVFVGIGAGAAAIGSTIAAALAQKPPLAVAENDPSIQTQWVKLPTGISAYAAAQLDNLEVNRARQLRRVCGGRFIVTNARVFNKYLTG